MNNKRPKVTSKTKAKIGFFARLMAALVEAGETGKNKNKVYAGFGVTTGNPIYTPKRTKFKGYMRNK